MTLPMFKIHSGFIGDHILGDNIVNTTGTLKVLYQGLQECDHKENKYYCKPIIVHLGAILDAVLYDFFKRMENNTVEGVRPIPAKVALSIAKGKRNKLEQYIIAAEKYKLIKLTWPDNDIYERMHQLKHWRNRIHMQNDKAHKPLKDEMAFRYEEVQIAEETLEVVLKYMSEIYKRPANTKHVKDFDFYWQEHQPDF